MSPDNVIAPGMELGAEVLRLGQGNSKLRPGAATTPRLDAVRTVIENGIAAVVRRRLRQIPKSDYVCGDGRSAM